MYVIKRIDVVSAMKVGALFNSLLFTVVGLLLFAFNSFIFGTLSAGISSTSSGSSSSFNPSTFAMAGLASCLVFYGIGVVFAAFSGAIFGALYAFFYNVIANWAGGLRVELAAEQVIMIEKPKPANDVDEFRF